MLREYIQAAMSKAHYEIIDQPSDPFCGTIPGLRGVIAIGRTLEECRENLEDALDGWIAVGLQLGHRIPSIGGVSLTPLIPRKRSPKRRLRARVKAG